MRRLPSRTVPRWLRRTFTAANVLSTLAVVVAASGTALAAVTYTGANIKDSTVESRDVANLTLATTDFTSSTSLALKVKGPTGDAGPRGPQGSDGPKGSTGDKGTPAPKAYTFQTVSQSATPRIKAHKSNPAPSELIPDCADVASDPLVNCPGFYMDDLDATTIFPRWNYQCLIPHCNVNAVSVPRMESSFQTVMQTSQSANGGLLDMPFPGTIILNATATFYTQRTDSQQRIDCQLQLSRVENGFAQSPVNVGTPISVYRLVEGDNASVGALNRQERLLNLHVTGAVAQTAGTFDAQLACRGLDDAGVPNDRIEFIEGNMSVLSTRTNGQA